MTNHEPDRTAFDSRAPWSVALLLTALALAVAGTLAAPAEANGITKDQLEAHGWTCVAPPIPGATRVSCFNPGVGRPFPGDLNPRPSYQFLAFSTTTGRLLGTGHLIRADLYAGQPCGGDEPYVFRAPIGYWECVRL